MRILLGMLLVALGAGCATTGYQRAAKTATGLRDTRAQVVSARQQVADTVGLLDQMVNAPQGDLLPQYQQFAAGVKAIEKAADRAAARANSYRMNKEAYIGAWADELSAIESKEVRTLSAQRRADAMTNFAAIEKTAAATRAAYLPFLRHLQGISQHLGQDLTAGGIDAIKPKAGQARQAAAVLQKQIMATLGELDRVADALAPRTQ